MSVPHQHIAEHEAVPFVKPSEPDTAPLAVPQVVHERTIARFSRVEWNALAIEPVRDWFYFQALERLELPGFSPVYFGVRCGGRLRAAIAGFLLDGAWRPQNDLVHDQLARVLRRIGRGHDARALVLGSPLNEPCAVALAPDADGMERRELLAQMLNAADAYASRFDYRVLAVKDVCAATEDMWEWACEGLHLRRLRDRTSAWPTQAHSHISSVAAQTSFTASTR